MNEPELIHTIPGPLPPVPERLIRRRKEPGVQVNRTYWEAVQTDAYGLAGSDIFPEQDDSQTEVTDLDRSCSFLYTAKSRGSQRAAVGRIREFETVDQALEQKQIDILNRAQADREQFIGKCIGRAVIQDLNIDPKNISPEEAAEAALLTIGYRDFMENGWIMPVGEEQIQQFMQEGDK